MNTAPSPGALTRRGGAIPIPILVTRPAAQAARLCQLITAAGGQAVAFPTVEILSTWSSSQGSALLSVNNLIKVSMLVFVSPTAAEQGLAALAAAGVTPQHWPPQLAHVAVAAIGRGTAAALARGGVARVIAPDGADSEALAALPAFQGASMAGKRVLIVRGEGGREWLADTLRGRGAQVEVAECYRRVTPQVDTTALAGRWMAGGIAAVTVHSRGALDNLLAMLPAAAHSYMMATPLFASHPRIAEHARVLGLQQGQVAGPGDDEMLKGIIAFFAKVAP